MRPQHFQAADRFWAEMVSTAREWDQPWHYGVQRIEISDEAIANYQLQVDVCHARMPDGTLVVLDAGQGPDRVDLKEAFEAESTVRVFLAVPKLQLGNANVDPEGQPGRRRYVEVTHAVQDESAGGNDQELQFRQLNAKLLLSTDETAGYELLPIAQLERAGEKEATPQIDGNYFPPMLDVEAWPSLGRGVVRAIYDVIGKKIDVLAQQVINRGITLASGEPGDLERLLMLTQLNQAQATLRVLAFTAGVHPFLAYTELCRIVGQLSIFGPERRVPEIPLYDHDDLATIFFWVRRQIEMLLEQIRDYQYEQRFFVGEGKGMAVSIESKWLGADWQWFVGVMRGTLSEKECLKLLSPGALDWKLGSSQQVDSLFEYGAEGLHLTPLAQAPRELPPGRDWLYFEVSRDNAAWNDVLETQTLAMRLKDSLIVNRAELPGKRKLGVSVAEKQHALQFALFAVPNRP